MTAAATPIPRASAPGSPKLIVAVASRFILSYRGVEDLLAERGLDIADGSRSKSPDLPRQR